MSMLPTLEATTYRAMYAFGNHLCVSSGENILSQGIVALLLCLNKNVF
jgi:hypothetical protein